MILAVAKLRKILDENKYSTVSQTTSKFPQNEVSVGDNSQFCN